MRAASIALLTALTLSACAENTAAPPDVTEDVDLGAVLAYDGAGFSGPGRVLVGIHRLPRELRLTEAQEAQIKSLLQRFEEATRADREALAGIQREADEARRAGKPRTEIAAILAKAEPIWKRLAEAEAALATQLEGVLTAEQKAWLAANQPPRCDRNTAALTEAQRTQIAALVAAHAEANKVDLDALKAALERFRAAQRNGATREQLKVIMEEIGAISARLRTAEQTLRAAIDALLTPEQRASGCYKGLTMGWGTGGTR
jgi:Spy/CpxP family protein refolding chaperone